MDRDRHRLAERCRVRGQRSLVDQRAAARGHDAELGERAVPLQADGLVARAEVGAPARHQSALAAGDTAAGGHEIPFAEAAGVLPTPITVPANS